MAEPQKAFEDGGAPEEVFDGGFDRETEKAGAGEVDGLSVSQAAERAVVAAAAAAVVSAAAAAAAAVAAAAATSGGGGGGRDQPKPDGRGKSGNGWTRADDEKIISLVQQLGYKWEEIAKQLTDRTGDAVRNRYMRHLKRKPEAEPVGGSASSGAPGSGDKALVTSADLEASEVHKGGDMWSPEEDAALVEGVRKHGHNWIQIAKTLPGRSPGASRNRYTRTQVKRAPVKAWPAPEPAAQAAAATAAAAALAAAAPPSLVLRQVAQPDVPLPDVVLTPGATVQLGRRMHGLPNTSAFKTMSSVQCTVTIGAAAPWRVMVTRVGSASTRIGTDGVEKGEARECKLGDAIVIGGKTADKVLVTYTLAHN